MAYVADPSVSLWTAVDLVRHFGPIPLHRVVSQPAPGAATVEDVVRMDMHEGRLCELIDGTLVEKTMGAFESFLAGKVYFFIQSYLQDHPLGIALTADGMLQLAPHQVRIPDACFISWERLEGTGYPEEAVPEMVPDLAAEIISRGNTVEEMNRKLREYFAAGVRLVWYVYPETRRVDIYTAADRPTTLTESDTLDGGEVLPGFRVSLGELFAPAKKPQ